MWSSLELDCSVGVSGGRLRMPRWQPGLALRRCGDAGPVGGLTEAAPASEDNEELINTHYTNLSAMSDETTNKETEPGTSKEDQEGATRDDRNRTDRESHIEKDDRDSYTESTESAVSSARERTEYMAERRANILKSPVLKLKGKGGERKKRRKVAGGRVGKRSRSIGGRKLRRGLKKRAKPQNRKYRAPSASTIFTRMTSISGSTRSAGISRIRGCEYCGHRCCRRR